MNFLLWSEFLGAVLDVGYGFQAIAASNLGLDALHCEAAGSGERLDEACSTITLPSFLDHTSTWRASDFTDFTKPNLNIYHHRPSDAPERGSRPNRPGRAFFLRQRYPACSSCSPYCCLFSGVSPSDIRGSIATAQPHPHPCLRECRQRVGSSGIFRRYQLTLRGSPTPALHVRQSPSPQRQLHRLKCRSKSPRVAPTFWPKRCRRHP